MVDPVVAQPTPPKTPLTVEVLDGFGAFLPGAEIEVVNFRTEVKGTPGAVKKPADANGQAEFGRVDPRIEFEIKVRKAGFGPTTKPFAVGDARILRHAPLKGGLIRVELTRNVARLTVRVTDLTTSQPLAGASVGVDGVTGDPMPLSSGAGFAGPFEVPVGVQVRFHAEKFAFGPQPGGIPFSGPVVDTRTFTDGQTFTATMGLHQGIALPLIVHVVDGFGDPLPGATVDVSGQGAKPTGANGRADFGLVNARDTFNISVRKDTFGPAASPFVVGPAQVSRQAPPVGTLVEFKLTRNVARLKVLVNDATDSAAVRPLKDCSVGVDGVTGTPMPLTGADGRPPVVEVPAGKPLRVHAEKDLFVPAAGGPFPINQQEVQTAAAPADGQTIDLTFALKEAVVLKTVQPVACPGLSYQIEAIINATGTFTWAANNGGRFVDGAGATLPSPASKIVQLRAFQPDNAAGTLPERTITVTLTLVSGGVTKEFKKDVKVHEITFTVTNPVITRGVTRARETPAGVVPAGVVLGNAPGIATMSTTPNVKITLAATCPQPAVCAGNHRVGWLQTVRTNTREARYSDTLVQTIVTLPLPIRDSLLGAPSPPFYGPVTIFVGNNDTQAAHHEDSPRQGATLVDPSPLSPGPPPPTNKQLRSMRFRNDFTAWLTVENIAWRVTDANTANLFLRNFDWHMELNVAVDTSQPAGNRVTPIQNPATIGALGNGQGGSAPVLALPTPNVNNTTTTSVAPHIP